MTTATTVMSQSVPKIKNVKLTLKGMREFEQNVGIVAGSELPYLTAWYDKTDIEFQELYTPVFWKYVEDQVSRAGYPMNSGAGPDVPQLNLEVKTHCLQSNSSRSLGSMTLENIMKTSWHHSQHLRDKLQQQYIVIWDRHRRVIKSARVYDFSRQGCQALLSQAFEHARAQLPISDDKYTATPHRNQVAYFEKKSRNSYAFRISGLGMKRLEAIALADMACNQIF
jgi:hypothetical protein